MNATAASSPPARTPTPLLEAEGLCKFYGGREVLHSVSLSLAPNEILTIVGPNGAGKTTLLNCLVGLDRPDHGTIHRKARLRIGYVPQHFTPQPSLPLRVVDFLALYAGKRNDAALIEELGIAAVLEQPLYALSGGELRRVLLARALMRRPQLLVLDEPMQGVDVGGQGELYRLIKRLSDRTECAVLMVSHDLHVVMASTDRVICLNRHICCEGTPKRVGNDPAFKALFGRELASQLAMYHHHHDHSHGVHEETFAHEGHTHG